MSCRLNCKECGKCSAPSILDRFATKALTFTPKEGYAVAIDIGTTTIVIAVVNMLSGKILARHGMMNPQRKFGADVISRINEAVQGGLSIMREITTSLISCEIADILNQANIFEISEITISCNTAMAHILLGLQCQGLSAYPFETDNRIKVCYEFSEIFGGGLLSCPVRIIPWISPFIGGDVTAGLLYTMDRGYKTFMLIDLGTNGELALYFEGGIIATSAAAGPAFEGACHSGGASAVLDDLARMLKNGDIDKTGRLKKNAAQALSQKDIRDLQLAKSAIRAGIDILIEEAGISRSGLDCVFLSGGIGQEINPESAMAVGLLPHEAAKCVMAAGNSALAGAVEALLSAQAWDKINEIKASTREIALATHPKFNDYFIRGIDFP